MLQHCHVVDVAPLPENHLLTDGIQMDVMFNMRLEELPMHIVADEESRQEEGQIAVLKLATATIPWRRISLSARTR